MIKTKTAVWLLALLMLLLPNCPAVGETRKIQIDETTRRVEQLDEQGNLTTGANGYAYALQTLDDSGKVIVERYYSLDGKPCLNQNSYYGVAYRYNEANQRVEISYLDAEGNIAPNASGYAIIKREYDDVGHAVLEMYYDADGEQTALGGNQYGVQRTAFDENGRNTEFTYIDKDGQPMVISAGYSTVKRTYNAAGKVEVNMYYGLDGEQVKLSLGQYGDQHVYNEQGQEIALIYLDAAGQPTETTSGYTMLRKDYVDGKVSVEWYCDRDGQLIELRRGQCGARYVYSDGKLQEKTPIDRNGNDLFFLDRVLSQSMSAVILGAALVMLASSLLPRRYCAALLGLYVLFILYMTLYVKESSGDESARWELFWSYRLLWEDEGIRKQIINNILLFVPLGFMLYRIRPHPAGIVLMALFSILIEGTQWVAGLGLCELDDVISNGLGGAAGFLMAKNVQRIRMRFGKRRSRGGRMIRIEEREMQMILSLLRYELFGQELKDDAATVDWEKMLDEANAHAITALLYSGIRKLRNVPEPIVNRIRGAAIHATIRSETVLNAQKKVMDLFEANGVPAAVLKGTSVACCYPHPELRVPGDVDILLGKNKVDAAGALLKNAGFEFDHDIEKHSCYHNEEISVELHRVVALFPELEKGQFAASFMEDALERRETKTLDGVSFPALSKRYQLVSLLAHMDEHMTSSGIGLRQLCDWAVTVHRLRGDIGKEETELLERCGLLRYASVATRISEKFLGLPACQWREDVPEELADAAMADILAVGNFQAQWGERSLSVTMMGSRSDSQPEIHSSVTNYIRYVRCKMDRQYSWAKSPLWTPVFSVYFPVQWLIRVLRGERKGANPIKSMKTAHSREKLLRELKLYR